MDVNKWNDIANKSERVKAKYAKRLSGIRKDVDGSTYICPWCGKIHNTSDAYTRVLRVGNDLIDKEDYVFSNTTTKTYVKVWYNIRCCEKCYRRYKFWTRLLYGICIIAYVIFGFLIVYWLIESNEDMGIAGWIGLSLIYVFIALLAASAKDTLEETLFNVADVEKAYKNNAIE